MDDPRKDRLCPSAWFVVVLDEARGDNVDVGVCVDLIERTLAESQIFEINSLTPPATEDAALVGVLGSPAR